MPVTAKIEVVTPEKASGWLTEGIFNRDLMQNHVHNLARQMREGKWDENGQGITLDDRGRLLDGQHRMNAIVEAGVPVKMLVVRGVDPKAFDTIDTGRPRYIKDVLSIQGIDMAEKYGATLRYIFRWYNGHFPGENKQMQASNADLLALSEKHPEAHDSVRWAFRRERVERIVTGKTSLAFAHWATTKARPSIAKRFWMTFATGEGERSSPAMALRNRLMYAFTTGDRQKKLSPTEVIALCAVAWRYEVEGTKFSMLKWNPRDGWPQFIGCETPTPTAKPKGKKVGKRDPDFAVA